MGIRLATMADFSHLDILLKQAAMRIKQKNSNQWSTILHNEEQETLKHHIREKEVYVYEVDESVAGMVYLYKGRREWDKALWEKQMDSYYLHKLALGDGYTGRGLAVSFLEELIELAKKEHTSIRLDCMSSKKVLNQLYQNVGFTYKGTVKQVDVPELPGDFNLYEIS